MHRHMGAIILAHPLLHEVTMSKCLFVAFFDCPNFADKYKRMYSTLFPKRNVFRSVVSLSTLFFPSFGGNIPFHFVLYMIPTELSDTGLLIFLVYRLAE